MIPDIISLTAFCLFFSSRFNVWNFSHSIAAISLRRYSFLDTLSRDEMLYPIVFFKRAYFSLFTRMSSASKIVRSIPLIELPGIYGLQYGSFICSLMWISGLFICMASPQFMRYFTHGLISSYEIFCFSSHSFNFICPRRRNFSYSCASFFPLRYAYSFSKSMTAICFLSVKI